MCTPEVVVDVPDKLVELRAREEIRPFRHRLIFPPELEPERHRAPPRERHLRKPDIITTAAERRYDSHTRS
jgi:hypothetical protein